MGLMNKILLVLIIVSGFLLIFYANNDIFTRTNHMFSGLFHGRNNSRGGTATFSPDGSAQSERLLLMDDPVAMAAVLDAEEEEDDEEDAQQASDDFVFPSKKRLWSNRTVYNLFVIYTKETEVLQKKYELLMKSLFKYATIPLHLHIITDAKSTSNAEGIARKQMARYHRHAWVSMLDMEQCVEKITDIVQVMMPYFTHPGSYYSDALFYLSLGLHRIADPKMRRGILIDCDVVFRSDAKLLFDQFHHFDEEHLFGLAPELTPVYRHTLYKYRALNPGTLLGTPYYPHVGSFSSYRRPMRHGYPGLNSGVVLLDFERMRASKFYAENLEAEQVQRLVEKYHFRGGHLGDQDFYTLLGYEFPSLIYRLDCAFNRQLCMWWKDHGYSDVFDTYFHCEGRIRVYHGNCNSRIPE